MFECLNCGCRVPMPDFIELCNTFLGFFGCPFCFELFVRAEWMVGAAERVAVNERTTGRERVAEMDQEVVKAHNEAAAAEEAPKEEPPVEGEFTEIPPEGEPPAFVAELPAPRFPCVSCGSECFGKDNAIRLAPGTYRCASCVTCRGIRLRQDKYPAHSVPRDDVSFLDTDGTVLCIRCAAVAGHYEMWMPEYLQRAVRAIVSAV